MLRFDQLPLFPRRPDWLLFLGLLAVALHALAGAGLMWTNSTTRIGGQFPAEVCTSHGVVKLQPAQTRDNSLPDAGEHDCCKLCAAGGPLLVADTQTGVPPAPTFVALQDSYASASPAIVVWTAHPPRGPPRARA